jgi:hypothetical protein
VVSSSSKLGRDQVGPGREHLAQLAEGRAELFQGFAHVLEKRILEGSDDQVLRVRAYTVADAWHAERMDTLRLFL